MEGGADGRAQVSLNEDDFPTRPPEVIFRANSLDGGVLPATRNKRPTSLATSVIHRPREPVLGENSCSERRHIQLFISEEDDSPVNQLLTRNETHHQLTKRLTNPEREKISADQLSQPQNRNAEHLHERNRSEGAEEQTQPLLGNTNADVQAESVDNLNRSSELDLHIWRSVSDQSEQSHIGNSNSSRRKAQIKSRKEASEARKGGSEWRSAASDLRWGRSEAEQRADSGNFSLLAEHINRNILACFICSAKFVDPKVQ
jgi:hypothetical protein